MQNYVKKVQNYPPFGGKMATFLKKWPPSWILKYSFIWIWSADYHASAAIIGYLDKQTCENGTFELSDLENDIET